MGAEIIKLGDRSINPQEALVNQILNAIEGERARVTSLAGAASWEDAERMENGQEDIDITAGQMIARVTELAQDLVGDQGQEAVNRLVADTLSARVKRSREASKNAFQGIYETDRNLARFQDAVDDRVFGNDRNSYPPTPPQASAGEVA